MGHINSKDPTLNAPRSGGTYFFLLVRILPDKFPVVDLRRGATISLLSPILKLGPALAISLSPPQPKGRTPTSLVQCTEPHYSMRPEPHNAPAALLTAVGIYTMNPHILTGEILTCTSQRQLRIDHPLPMEVISVIQEEFPELWFIEAP